MTMSEAMMDGLTLMSDVLGGSRKKVDEKLVKAYLFVVVEDGLLPADIEAAARHFSRDGEGMFPAGPVFRKECLRQKYNREVREERLRYEAKTAYKDDLYADEHDPIATKAETRAAINAVLERLARKPNPLTDRPRVANPQDQIRTMRGLE